MTITRILFSPRASPLGNRPETPGTVWGMDKATLRPLLLSARERRTVDQRRQLDEALVLNICAWIREELPPASLPSPIVAAYVPSLDEPGGSLGEEFLRRIASAVPKARLLLPVCPPGPPAPLRWGFYSGYLVKGRFGLLEPIAVADSLSPDSLSLADAAILPALAANPATGIRIGRGAGYYDRSLAYFRGHSAVTVFPDELRHDIPADPHDVGADAVISADGIATTERP